MRWVRSEWRSGNPRAPFASCLVRVIDPARKKKNVFNLSVVTQRFTKERVARFNEQTVSLFLGFGYDNFVVEKEFPLSFHTKPFLYASSVVCYAMFSCRHASIDKIIPFHRMSTCDIVTHKQFVVERMFVTVPVGRAHVFQMTSVRPLANSTHMCTLCTDWFALCMCMRKCYSATRRSRSEMPPMQRIAVHTVHARYARVFYTIR